MRKRGAPIEFCHIYIYILRNRGVYCGGFDFFFFQIDRISLGYICIGEDIYAYAEIDSGRDVGDARR